MALEVYSKQQGTNMISQSNVENDPKICWWNCYSITVIGVPHANLPLLKCLFFGIPVEYRKEGYQVFTAKLGHILTDESV